MNNRNKNVLSLSPGLITAIIPANKQGASSFWVRWVASLAIISFVFILFIDVAPYLHSDEFTIVDLGRIILNPGTGWGLPWISDKDQPVFAWFYLGPILQEFAFHIAGEYGPRLSGIAGALAAATVMLCWLRSRGTMRKPAFWLGIVFLLDPLFVQAYTLGRVDGWTMAFCLASCWTLRATANHLSFEADIKKRLLLASGLLVVALFVWPSAVFLFPLVLLELVHLSKKYSRDKENWKQKSAPFVLFSLFSIGMVVLLTLPIINQALGQFENIKTGIKANTSSGEESQVGFGIQSIMYSVYGLLQILKFTPLVTLFALFAAIEKKQTRLILAVVCTTALMLCTLVYMHRVQYLLPYLVVLISGSFLPGEKGRNVSPSSILIKRVTLILLVIWAAGLSLFARSILAFDNREERKRDLIFQAGESMLGSGRHAVFLPAPEFYYAGRSFGWEMYRPYTGYGDTISVEALHRILPHVDYAIIPDWELSEAFILQLNKAGMHDNGWYKVYPDYQKEDFSKTTNIIRLRNLYSIFRQPYGPYKLYARNLRK